jgi:hypothetical protein
MLKAVLKPPGSSWLDGSVAATLESNSHEHSPDPDLRARHGAGNASFESVPIPGRAEAPSAPRRSPAGAAPIIRLRFRPRPGARPGSGCDEQRTETLAGQAAVRRWRLPNPPVRFVRWRWRRRRRWWRRRNVRGPPNPARRPVAEFLQSIGSQGRSARARRYSRSVDSDVRSSSSPCRLPRCPQSMILAETESAQLGFPAVPRHSENVDLTGIFVAWEVSGCISPFLAVSTF